MPNQPRLRKLLGWPLGYRNVITVILLILARYLFRFGSLVVIDLFHAAMYLEAASIVIAVLSSTRGWNDITQKPWQMILSLLFLATVITAVIVGDSTGRLHEWSVSPVVSIYLVAMSFVKIFGGLIALAGRQSPALILPASFVMVILAGTALLMTPRATTGGISPLDSLFTATSATCVTGLIVKDTGADFTFIGQLIILLMVQVGGLGLMTFAAFFAMTFGQHLGLAGTTNLSRLMDSEFTNDLKYILRSILVWTIVIETAGALLLYNTWADDNSLGWSTGYTVWQSIFHSVSAFCNAGFSLNSTNLELFADSPLTSLVVGFLIILGGLGFTLLTTLGRNWLKRIRTGRRWTLPVQTRLVLIMTTVLIITGSGLFLAMEWNNTLSGMPFLYKLSNSFLQGVTTRTAGFNTVPVSGLVAPVKWFFIVFMFIGASPGGTGGGVKTTTIGLLLLSIISLVKHRNSPEIWGRRIPIFDLQRAGAILLVGLATFGFCTFLLLAAETSTETAFSPMDYVFESMSAFGTVGLSTGVTPFLSTAGKWIVVVTMFIGRTAPATLAAATFRVKSSPYGYPEARITIG